MAKINEKFIVNLKGKDRKIKPNGWIHGMHGTRINRIWAKMKERCNNPNSNRYHLYGGRGITVCDEWQDFLPFYKWAKENGYDDHLTIDRIDNNGNYEPSNCRWVTPREQALNRSTNVIIEYEGKKQTATEWAEELGMKPMTLLARIRRGWDVEDALTREVRDDGKANSR